jgi:hypothetical protein
MGRIVVDKYNIIRDEPLIVSVASPSLKFEIQFVQMFEKKVTSSPVNWAILSQMSQSVRGSWPPSGKCSIGCQNELFAL